VIPHPLPALALGYGSENIKAALEPIIEAVRDFDGLTLGVIGGIKAIYDRLRTIDRKVAVELNHGVCRIDQVRSIHLDLIVALSTSEWWSEDNSQQYEHEKRTVHKAGVQENPGCHTGSVTHGPNILTTPHEEDYQLYSELRRGE
jgi:hypothetical protein